MGSWFTRTLAFAATVGFCVAASSLPACTDNGSNPVSSPCPPGKTCQVRLTLLHTADIHSRLFEYNQVITQVDSNLGLGPLDANVRIGGVSRLSYVINRERARSSRVLHLDSGDVMEGAPIFNFFNGEPEMRYQSMIGVDAAVIGNHEFDHGLNNLVTQYQRFAEFPVLAANYDFASNQSPGFTALGTIASPFTVFNQDGLKVAVIGMGNLSSLGSLFDQPNSAGIVPLNTHEVAQFYVDLLRPYVDVVVMLSHLGLEADQDMVQNTTGIDIVLGGHNHIVINPPQPTQDCSADPLNPGYIWEVDPNLDIPSEGTPPNDAKHPDPINHPYEFKRPCRPRNVLIMHSGAFAKYLGRIDLTLSNNPADLPPTFTAEDIKNNGFEIISSDYTPFPITDDLPEDPVMVDMLQPYQRSLDRVADLDILVGFSPNGAKRIAGNGGDSPLGNLIANAMWLRLGIQTDFSLTNSTGIRTDLNPGPVTQEEIYNIFPFDNTISKMQLSGLEVQEMFDFVARRTASRGCASQVQIAGARVQLNCAGCSRPNAGTACTVDTDCPDQSVGQCQNGFCQVTACADAVFIGHQADPKDPSGNTYRKCNLDTDCVEKIVGQCDHGPPSNTGNGYCLSPIGETNLYELATSNYIAAGGSGFRVLQRNTTQFDTKIQQRDALVDYLRQGHPCGYDANAGTAEGLKACVQDSDCSPDSSIVCACAGHAQASGSGDSLTCAMSGQCTLDTGRCVRADCRNQVAQFHSLECAGSPNAKQCNIDLNACSLGGEECKFLSCVDESLGNYSDNRVQLNGK